MSSKCGSEGGGGSDSSETPCQKSKSKSDCSKPKKSSCESEDEKCHSSQKKFKQQMECEDGKDGKEKCPKSGGDNKVKCHSSQEAFGQRCPTLPAEESATPKEECSSTKTVKPACEASCYDNVKDSYIKLSDMCKSLAKQALKLRPKSKCNGVDEAVDACGKGLALPPSRPPCDPAVESGMGAGAKYPCTAKFSGPCPQAKVPSIRDFFPIDARNKKLNDCIEKYTKLDPNQVISKCSQFASQTSHVTEQCAQAVRRGQATCARTVRSSPAAQKTVRFLGPRHIQLVQRWTPTAAVYLASTALLAVYVTEWRTALRYLPFYQPSSLGEQEES